MTGSPPPLRDSLPTVARALAASLVREGETLLAAQVGAASVHALCECGADDCLSFYLSPPVDDPCAGDYRVVMPEAVLTIGVCDERIGWVQDEVLRDDDETRQRVAEYRSLAETVARHVVQEND